MMDLDSTARSLAALGHPARLDVFRLLVRAGHGGLTVGQIRDSLGLAPSTLAHHLRSLVDAGLIVQTKSGRDVINTIDFAKMAQTLEFLTAECCTGVTIQREDDAA